MNADISVLSATARFPGTPVDPWMFAFTTGYGSWASGWSYHGCSTTELIPWDADFRIVIDDLTVPLQVSDGNLGDQCYRAPGDSNWKYGIVSWTRVQWLYLTEARHDLRSFPWERPYTCLCSLYLLEHSGFYSDEQIAYLQSYFWPDWAQKGGIIDDQSYFDAFVPGQIVAYGGLFKYFMNRLYRYLSREGLLSICVPLITDDTRFSIEGEVPSEKRTAIQNRMSSFFSSELQIGVFKRVTSEAIVEFHNRLPARLMKWIEKPRG